MKFCLRIIFEILNVPDIDSVKLKRSTIATRFLKIYDKINSQINGEA